MGRKAREKRLRLKKGDIIHVLEDGTGFPAGVYIVDSSNDSMVGLRVGNVTTMCNRKYLPPYRKIDQNSHSIDWDRQQRKIEEFYANLETKLGEEIELPDVGGFDGVFEQVSRCRLLL